MEKTARDEIESFLASKEAGIKSTFSATKITYALSQMYTLQGKICPVRVLEKNGDVYLLNREILQETQTNV